jgi:hypothetical protein
MHPLSLLCILPLLVSPVFGQPEASRRDLVKALDAAWKSQDSIAFSKALDDAWTADGAWTAKRCEQILSSDADYFRPSALAAIARHADVPTLARLITTLNRQRYIGERRFLIYALANHSEEQVASSLAALARDQDQLIRAAAVTTLGTFNKPELLEPFASSLREHPAWTPESPGGDEHVLQMALYSAIEHITRERPGSAREAKLLLTPAKPTAPPATADTPETIRVLGKSYFHVPRANLLFDLGPKSPVSSGRTRTFEKEILPVVEDMIKISTPYFGPIQPAAIRLIIADKQRFSGYAGNSFRPGVSQGNQVVLRDMDPDTMRAVLSHEYIHVLQQAAFANQPRWLVEGMAESLSISRKETVWSRGAITSAGLLPDINTSIFGVLLNWDGAASSGDQESRLYRMSHVAMDFLRFGPHGDADVRLFLLMSRVGEKENSAATLKALYGGDAKEMDAKLREWLGMK